MERLTIKFPNGYLLQEPKTEDGALVYINAIAEKLGELEDAEEAGLLLKLPYPIDTPLYIRTKTLTLNDGIVYGVEEVKVKGYRHTNEDDCHIIFEFADGSRHLMCKEDMGYAYFLTREEAEQALAEMQKG